MQFEEFDNKVKEAADHHYPAYDENAWGRMEKLLDKHLPRENDNRRRIIFFFILFLGLGGGAVWLFSGRLFGGGKQTTTAKITIQKPGSINSVPVSTNEENQGTANLKPGKEVIDNTDITGNDKTTLNPSAQDQLPASLHTGNENENQFLTSSTTGVKRKKIKTDQQVKTIRNNNASPVTGSIDKDQVDKNRVDISTTNATVGSLSTQQKNDKKDLAAEKNNNSITTVTKTTDAKAIVKDPFNKENTNKDNITLVQNSQDKKTNTKNKKGNNFFFSLSAGPDISATGGDKPGKVKLLAGGGLGYTFKDRLTIRSGFYTGRKIYTSSPGSYHPPESFWSYYPNLEKVDADCKVYEIPLSLSYNFGHSSKQNLFGSAGISSYLMKQETYTYYFKYSPGGATVQKNWTLKDENKHYFSVLTLSGGFQKNIGKNLSIVVEPYFKMPLGGVGFGKVKLNSGGILFSAVIKPFARSGKQSNPHH